MAEISSLSGSIPIPQEPQKHIPEHEPLHLTNTKLNKDSNPDDLKNFLTDFLRMSIAGTQIPHE